MNIVLVGGSYGIGNSYYKKMKAKGDSLKVLSRTQNEIEDADWVEFDIQNSITGEASFPETFDTIDALIYLPGSIKLGLFKSFKPDDFIDDYKLNVVGALSAIKACHKNLQNSEQASITLFSSVVAQNGMPMHSIVGSSKGAIEGLVKNLSAEFAPKIRVNALALSLVDTPLAKKITSNEKALKMTIQRHPLKKIGSVDDVSDMIQVLTHFSPWMTGQVIGYDGGISAIR